MLVRKLFSKHLLGFILLQLGQPAAKGHIQSDVDVLRKTSAAGMQPICHFAKFQPVFHVPLLSYPLPDECRFRIILKGAAAYIRENKTKQCGATACLPVLHSTAPSRQKLPGQGCAVCRKFISRPLGRAYDGLSSSPSLGSNPLLRVDFLQQPVCVSPLVHHIEDKTDVNTNTTGKVTVEVDVT